MSRRSVRSGSRGRFAHAARTLCALAAMAAAAHAGAAELNWPSKDIVRPRDVPLSYPCAAGKLCDLKAYMERQHVCALRVMSGGVLALQQTMVRSDDDLCRSPVERNRFGIASITKSLVSLLFGFVYQNPDYAPPVDLDSRAADLLGAEGVKYGGTATLRQLLQMASGMQWSEDEIDSTLKIQVDENGELVGKHRQLLESVKARLEGAKFGAPGTFLYSGFDSQLIGILTEHRLTADKGFARRTLDEGLETFLWKKLPVARNVEWNADFAGHPSAHCCAYVALEDFAALGDWLIQQYNEGEEPIADWVRASASNTVVTGWSCTFQGTRRDFRFGYQWWVPSGDPRDGFTGIGTEGQYLHIFPEQDVVIVQFGEKLATDPDTCEAMLVHRLLADQLSDE